jgi:hypothetical protein
MSKKAKDSAKALKGTTFYDLFNVPTEDVSLKPIDEEEFLEDVVAICYRTLLDIVRNPDEKAYVKISAIDTLLDRAKGKPVAKTEVKDTSEGPQKLTDEQLRIAIAVATEQSNLNKGS